MRNNKRYLWDKNLSIFVFLPRVDISMKKSLAENFLPGFFLQAGSPPAGFSSGAPGIFFRFPFFPAAIKIRALIPIKIG